MHIDFYFDFLSPYSFFASKLFQKQSWYPDMIRYKPAHLPMIVTKSGNKPPTTVPAKLAWSNKDLRRIAKMHNIELQSPKLFHFTVKYLNAAVASLNEEQRHKATNLIYEQVWSKGHFEDNNQEYVQSLLKEAGIELGTGWFEKGMNVVTLNTEEAVKKGAFGVPTFVLYKDGDENGELFWGADRIDQLSFFVSSKL
jgi:2-hydroxychromene-2-carboxylate isomerase